MEDQQQPLTKRWLVAERLPPEADTELSAYPPVLRQILHNRGYSTNAAAQQFLEAHPPKGADPFAMKGIPEAAELIIQTILKNKGIAVFGDYDVDGVTATALLTQALESIGGDVLGYIPNRFDEGYGLNTKALDSLYKDGVRLVITVDCGIRSPREVEYAQNLGMDMIITDHHHPGPTLPQAAAVINPKQNGDSYPEKNLAGVGIAYKLAAAVIKLITTTKPIQDHFPPATDYLDLVALGTVADVTPLVGENRSLVRRGLEYLSRPHRQGIMSLLGVTGLAGKRVTAENIGFILGPRINAAGRLDSAMVALDLLTTQDVREAAYLAQSLDNQNRERQAITRDIQIHAEETALAEDHEGNLFFAAHVDYNPGIVGLAASRLVDKYYRPSIVAHIDSEFTRGSCRSIKEFHITEALDQCADILVRHGGHAAAAGFTVRNQDVPELQKRLKNIAKQQLDNLDLRPTLEADIDLPLRDLRPELLNELSGLQPTGHQNPAAIFVSRDLQITRSRTVGKEGAHLKLTVTDGRITYDAIAFRLGHWRDHLPPRVDLIYRFELNEFNGRSMLQLNVKDLKPTGNPD